MQSRMHILRHYPESKLQGTVTQTRDNLDTCRFPSDRSIRDAIETNRPKMKPALSRLHPLAYRTELKLL